MTDRPEQFAYQLGNATVVEVYPDSWEVDLKAEDGGMVRRAIVMGPRLPERSSKDRPQWAVWGYASHVMGRAVCWPVESRMVGTRLMRKDLVFYHEVLNWQLLITRDNELTFVNRDGNRVTRITVKQEGPFIHLDTPEVHLTLDDAGHLAELRADHIHLGHGASEAMVLGTTFANWLSQFLAVFNGHTHPDAGTNNNPAPSLPTILSEVSRTL